MDRLCHFLKSRPPEIVRIKGFVNANGNPFLVQADTGGFTIEKSTANPSKQGLQVIGTLAMNSNEVISSIRKIERL